MSSFFSFEAYDQRGVVIVMHLWDDLPDGRLVAAPSSMVNLFNWNGYTVRAGLGRRHLDVSHVRMLLLVDGVPLIVR